MKCPRAPWRSRAFTLIELLIVVVVIAILALIIIPRVRGAIRMSRESTLRANLHHIRTAIDQFSSDTGVFPDQLIDLTNPKSDPPRTGIDENGDPASIPSSSYQGPYLTVTGGIGATGIPVNPFKRPNEPDYLDETTHWTYGVDRPGSLHPAVPVEGNTIDGVPYSEL